ANVELSLAPLAVTLNQLQIADADQPMQNIFEASQIKMSLDPAALLWKKIVVEELNLSGAKSGSPRTSSGALEGGRRSVQAVEQMIDIKVPELSQADVEKLVSDADLITLKRVETFKQEQSRVRQEWSTALDKEAFDKRIAAIKSDYKRLSERAKENKLNLIKDRKQWKELKRRIDAEKKQISGLSGKLKADKKLLADQYEAVKKGPQDDLDRLMQNFGLGNGVDGLVDKYLGPQYTPWVNKAIEFTKSFDGGGASQTSTEEKATIAIGERVFFTDKIQMPDYLVKKLVMSGEDANWTLDGKGFDVGYLPWLTGKPAKLNLQFGGKGQASFDLDSNWQSSSKMNTQVDAKVNSWPIESMQLMATEEGNWIINSGTFTADISGQMSLQQINLNAVFAVRTPKLELPSDLSGWRKSLGEGINQQEQIDFKLTASGSLVDPKIRLESNLEKVMQNALGEQVKQKAAELKGDVKAKLTEKVGDLSSLQDYAKEFDQWKDKMNAQLKVLEQYKVKI
ncbi:MAG: TIGR03545 family protein, partial [Kangiellaceae bacterium]|nr:TIGR03545 family protein [Kangiellaceae bacterium]